jgi:EmrB/QacA subfamily drug resistance transporter
MLRKKKTQKTDNGKLPKELTKIAWILVAGAIAPMLDSTMVNIAVNNLGHDFGTSLSTIQWVITGFALAVGVMVPLSGWLTNRFEGKRVFFIAELGFLISSLLCGISWNISSLIIFRLLQGASTGIIIPMLMNLILSKSDKNQLGRLIVTIGLPMILGPILGPVIGGFLVQWASWRLIFFVNILFSGIALLLISKLPKFPARKPSDKLDFIGLVLLAALSSAFIYGIVEAGTHATFSNSTTILCIVLGAALMIFYIAYARVKKEQALLPLKLFKSKNFSAATIGLFMGGLAVNGPMLLLPLFFQNIRGMSVLVSALALIPQGLGMMVARPTIGKMIDKIGARSVVLVCLAIAVVGSLPFAFFNASTPIWLLMAILFIRGIGVGGITMPIMSDAYVGVEDSEVPQATSGTRIVQNIGGAFGSAVIATVVASSLVAATSSNVLGNLTSAYQHGFLLATILSTLIIVPALFLTDKRKLSKVEQQATEISEETM